MRLNYLVTGTGRSGTVFMARLLTSLNIPCSHEMIFDYRGLRYAEKRLCGNEHMELSWASRSKYANGNWTELDVWLEDPRKIEAEASYMAVPYLNESLLKDTKIIHVVRDPVKVVNSFCNYIDFFKDGLGNNAYEHFIYSHIPELKNEMPKYDRAALYWIRWNQMVEARNPHLLHRIEDSPDKVVEFLGKEGPYFNDTTINTFKKSISERFFPDKIANSSIREEFVATGKRYGYSMRSEYLLI